MNKRKLSCGNEILAIGEAGSIADLKEKIKTCFECNSFIFCTLANDNFKKLLNQKENITALNRKNQITKG
jgi:hypothetical protein